MALHYKYFQREKEREPISLALIMKSPEENLSASLNSHAIHHFVIPPDISVILTLCLHEYKHATFSKKLVENSFNY